MERISERSRLLMYSLLLFLLAAVTISASVNAKEVENEPGKYFGTLVNAGKDAGYSERDKIQSDDLHFGWKLGQFYVSGYSRVNMEQKDNPVFLKTVGDKVILEFELWQDIDKLNGDDLLSISQDEEGQDEELETEKTDFGRGALIVRHTDYQNKKREPQIYKNYLEAVQNKKANTQIELAEEGDYEVALDYEIRESKNLGPITKIGVFDSYQKYRIFFKFSIRSGECNIYPFDVVTKSELGNESVTEDGFYLDLAKSRYLDIQIKKEVLKEGASGLTTDSRFNRAAKDGESYTEEGVYTITVKNKDTEEETTKIIYVGTNNILKAYAKQEKTMSIEEIQQLVDQGATIEADGTIVPVSAKKAAASGSASSGNQMEEASQNKQNSTAIIIVVLVIVVIAIGVGSIIWRKRKKQKEGSTVEGKNEV